VTQIVREFSPAGPCLTLGKLVGESAQFWTYLPWRGGDRYDGKPKRVAKRTEGRYSPAHVEVCPSCRDHARTMYPNGYMD